MLILALFASLIDIALGYPDWLYAAIGHPVGAIAWVISACEARLNRPIYSDRLRKAGGVGTVVLLVVLSAIIGYEIETGFGLVPFGEVLTAIVASTLLAHRSLDSHVAAVAPALVRSLEEGRKAVSRIVGRDPETLDEAGVARAAIESLAENFSDGVVAPLFWLAVLGLPGCLAYKAINTADSMIGHLSDRYRQFGWAAARTDDVVNLPASRLAALWLILAAFIVPGASGKAAFTATMRDAAKHRSPNAGWPEAAMAGALGLALGGTRFYQGARINGAFMGNGRQEATAADILRALTLYRVAAGVQFGCLALIAAAIYSIASLS